EGRRGSAAPAPRGEARALLRGGPPGEPAQSARGAEGRPDPGRHAEPRGARARDRAGPADHQDSGMLTLRSPGTSSTITASPPRAFSLYLSFMSAPVSRMVLMPLSKDTKWWPPPRRAMRAALTAFTAAIAFLSMQGTCTSPPMGSQVRPRL